MPAIQVPGVYISSDEYVGYGEESEEEYDDEVEVDERNNAFKPGKGYRAPKQVDS